MTEDEFVCIRQVKKTVLLALPGCYAYNELVGIKKILEKWKRKYVPHLKGVMVDYRNITFSMSSGVLASNAPKSCYHVTATFDLFCPKVGDITKGKINRTSKDHIGCLIQNTINVSIRLPRHLDLSKFIHLNQEILFEIIHFNFTQHVIDVKGKITPKCIELMNILYPQIDLKFNKLDDSTFDEGIDIKSDSSNDDATTEINLTSNIPNTKIKFENDFFPLFLSSKESNLESAIKNESDTSTVVASPRKKKKHKKKSVESNISNPSAPKVPTNSAFLDPNTIGTSFQLQPIKQEMSPTKSPVGLLPSEPNKKKRKRESSVSDHDASGSQPKKKKRHKSKDTKNKNTGKKSKSKKEKPKSLKKKAKLAASGTVLKKDKKKPQKSKREKKLDGQKSKKSKKNKDKKKDKTARKQSKKLKCGNLEVKSEFE